jgi:hypothetical protein
MPRLQKPYTDTIPEDSRIFLAQFPPDEMFQMLSHSPAMVQPYIRLGLTITARCTFRSGPVKWRFSP